MILILLLCFQMDIGFCSRRFGSGLRDNDVNVVDFEQGFTITSRNLHLRSANDAFDTP